MAYTKHTTFPTAGLLCLTLLTTIVLQGCHEINKSAEKTQNTAPSQTLSQQDTEALELGRKVLAVKAAIQAPTDPGSLDAVRDLGLDSRYYVMVRGWLSMELSGGTSIIEASRENVNPQIRQRVDFLKKAIRAIDLE